MHFALYSPLLKCTYYVRLYQVNVLRSNPTSGLLCPFPRGTTGTPSVTVVEHLCTYALFAASRLGHLPKKPKAKVVSSSPDPLAAEL